MKKVCAWCGRSLSGGAPSGGGPVSHGICVDCASEVAGEAAAFRAAFDYLPGDGVSAEEARVVASMIARAPHLIVNAMKAAATARGIAIRQTKGE